MLLKNLFKKKKKKSKSVWKLSHIPSRPYQFIRTREKWRKKLENEIGLSHWQWKILMKYCDWQLFWHCIVATFFFSPFTKGVRDKKRRTMVEYCTNYSLKKAKKLFDYWRKILTMRFYSNNFFIRIRKAKLFSFGVFLVYRYGLWSWDVLNLKIRKKLVMQNQLTGRGS